MLEAQITLVYKMHMKRDATTLLLRWLDGPGRKPLIVRGARQVGKSFLVNGLSVHCERHVVSVDLERHPELDAVFATRNLNLIMRELSVICKRAIDDDDCILFLDEIQACPQALPCLRYFYEDRPQLPVIAAGSLLEQLLANHSFSMPVGRIEYLFLGPLTFEEYLAAKQEDYLLELLHDWSWASDPFPEQAHRALVDHLRLFMLAGGMPEAMACALATDDLSQVDRRHASLLETYSDDFAKYARSDHLLRLRRIFDYIPAHAGEKVVYRTIDPDTQSRELRRSIELLTQARVVLPVHRSTSASVPVAAGVDHKVYKLFFLDCGLLAHRSGIRWIEDRDLRTQRFINEGNLAEQFLAQHLLLGSGVQERPELFYWLRDGRSTNAEIDFLLPVGSTVVPVEVKAGKSGAMKSLLHYVHTYGTPTALRFDLNPPSAMKAEHRIKDAAVSFTLLSLPLYFVGQSRRLLREWEQTTQ